MNLRRTVQPYIGQTVILVGVTLLFIYVGLKNSDTQFLWPLLIWPLYAFPSLYFGLKYRVRWDETGVYMRASGGPERHIGFDEIANIKYETAVSQSRPFRRIVIHGQKHDPKAFVDVSLRHFRLDDIDEMMNAIRTRRPELRVPTVSTNGRVSFS